jgi:hypothetical protein
MRTHKGDVLWTIFRILPAALCLTIFTACPTEASDDGTETEIEIPEDELTEEGGVKTLKLSVSHGAVKFYSLTTGTEITGAADIAGHAWDIAFKETRTIWTNSGATAEEYSSGGQGGVWHTSKKNFEQTELEDAVTNDPVYSPFNTDTIRWAPDMQAYKKRFMNVMTFLGWSNENSPGAGLSQDNPYSTGLQYNKRAFYSMPTMGSFVPTKYVYIIRHADGAHYSKIQVQGFVRALETDINDVAEGQGAVGTDTFEVLIMNYGDGVTLDLDDE